MSESLNSSLESSRRSSRSPTPSRTPQSILRIPQKAPYDPTSRYPTWLRILTSGWFYYTTLIFTLLLLLTVGNYYLSVDYCVGNEFIDCKPCPNYFNCSKTKLSCDGDVINGVCLPKNHHIYHIYNEKIDLLRELVINGTVKTISNIRSHQEFANEPSQTISLLVSTIEGYKVKNGKIVKDVSENVRFSIVLSTFVISLACFLSSLYFRNKPPKF